MYRFLSYILIFSTCIRLADNCIPAQNPSALGNRDPIPPEDAAFIDELINMLSQLGGTASLDLTFPVIAGPPPTPYRPITASEQLFCDAWSALFVPNCRWWNEPNTVQGGVNGDELQWARANGLWDPKNGQVIFGTDQLAAPPWMITGTSVSVPPDHSAMLVSDVVKCQEGDGIVSFQYWTSPGTTIRVCTRAPTAGKNFDFCSPKIKGGDPGPAEVTIPGSILDPFELIVEASGFDFNDFGKQGGAVVIDNLNYQASQVENCKGREDSRSGERTTEDPRRSTRRPNDDDEDFAACETIKCSFDGGQLCLRDLSRNGWAVQRGPIGNRHTGIRTDLQGPYGVAQGPAKEKVLTTRPFDLNSDKVLEFCYYRASVQSKMVVRAILERGDATEMFRTQPLNSANPHSWVCERTVLRRGAYEALEFIAVDLRNRYSYFGLDEVNLLDSAEDFARPIC